MLHFPFKVVENTPISFTPNNHKISAAGAGGGGQVIGPSRHHFSAAPPSHLNATPADGFTEVSLEVTTLHSEDQRPLSKVFGGVTPYLQAMFMDTYSHLAKGCCAPFAAIPIFTEQISGSSLAVAIEEHETYTQCQQT